MHTKTSKLNTERKHLYKLLDNFNEKELYTVKKFVEFVDNSKKNKDTKLLQILLDASYEEKELSEQTKKNLAKSDGDIKKGKFEPLSKVMKEYGL